MKLLKQTLQSYMVPALLIWTSVSVVGGQLHQKTGLFVTASVVGIAVSLFFTLTTGSATLLLPGVFQMLFLTRNASEAPQLTFVAGVVGALLYATGALYYAQKFISRSIAIITKLLVAIVFLELLVSNTYSAKGLGWAKIGELAVVGVLLFASQISQLRKWRLFLTVSAFMICFVVSAAETQKAASESALLVTPAMVTFENEISNVYIVKGIFLALIGLLESSVASIHQSQITGKNQLRSDNFEITVVNLLMGTFGLLPLSRPMIATCFASDNQARNHAALLGSIAKVLMSAAVFGFFDNNSLLFPVMGAFAILSYLRMMASHFAPELSYRNSRFCLFSVLLFTLVFAITRNKLVAFVTSLSLDLTVLLFNTNQICGHSKSADASAYQKLGVPVDQTIVYQLQKGLNFLSLEAHKQRILDLPERHIIVDLTEISSSIEREYIESYRELVESLRGNVEHKIVVIGADSLIKQPKSATKSLKIKSI